METILKLSIGLLVIFNVYIWISIYNALNEPYVVILNITV